MNGILTCSHSLKNENDNDVQLDVLSSERVSTNHKMWEDRHCLLVKKQLNKVIFLCSYSVFVCDVLLGQKGCRHTSQVAMHLAI